MQFPFDVVKVGGQPNQIRSLGAPIQPILVPLLRLKPEKHSEHNDQ